MSVFEKAYNEVAALVRKFDEHKDQFLAPKYQEAEVRAEFLDNFFIALGWDVRHIEQTNPREQEVKIEKSDSVSFRKADYAFYLKPEYQRPVFLVEAKKPWEDLSKPEYYFQTARYGFNTSTSVAVLTDFKEFHIIDCRRKPELVSGIVEATRLFKFTYQQYLDRDIFGEIYWKFSREAVAAGKLKEYWKSLKKPKGAAKQLKLVGDQLQPPDDLFLEDLDKYRKELASAFKSANKELTSQDLTEAAQKVLDRLVFIRFLQDKGIISDFIIEKFTSDAKASSWKSFIVQSQKLDKDYNGVVFKEHFIDRPSFIPPKDDRFSLIADEFSHKRSPYLFSYIPVEILGSIYERFLGKVVVPKGSGIAVEEKPEVRKAGGVYYTPKYIVDYIVTNTVGKILDDKSPTEVANLRFADIACGSGSFLIAIFDVVNTHLERWYSDHPIEAVNDGCRELDPDEQGRTQYGLSLEQKRAILQNNIFGVDIDKQAVEVAQFSLFLKLLESETIASVQLFSSPTLTSKRVSKGQITFHHGVNRKILPDLSKNIQCGNSLVEYDISDLFPLTPEEEMKIKPFSFNQAFKPIMDAGGFDAIVGNPPYFSLSTIDLTIQKYFGKAFLSYDRSSDIYCLFFEKSISLLRHGGVSCYITSNQWLQTNYGRILRKYFVEHCNPQLLINFGGLKIFQGATVDTSILVLKKEACDDHLLACHFKNDFSTNISIEDYLQKNSKLLTDLRGERWEIIDDNVSLLKKKIRSGSVLVQDMPIKINRGILTGFNEAFIIDTQTKEKLCFEDPSSLEIVKPILRGRDIHEYSVEWPNLWLIVTKNGTQIAKYPAIFEHLKKYETPLKIRGDQGEHWWNLRACVYYDLFDVDKIIYPETTVRRSEFFLDRNKFVLDKTAFMITGEDLTFLNGILSSSLMEWFLETELRLLGKNSIQYSKQFIDKVPIPKSPDKTLHDRLVNLVDHMLATKKQLAATQRDSEKEQLQRKCDYLDGEIDRLVYALYGLTAEEIKIVEGK